MQVSLVSGVMAWASSPKNSEKRFVLVCQGPIHCDDRTGRADTLQPWFDLSTGPKAWFTERTLFETPKEYRFAINMLGNPV